MDPLPHSVQFLGRLYSLTQSRISPAELKPAEHPGIEFQTSAVSQRAARAQCQLAHYQNPLQDSGTQMSGPVGHFPFPRGPPLCLLNKQAPSAAKPRDQLQMGSGLHRAPLRTVYPLNSWGFGALVPAEAPHSRIMQMPMERHSPSDPWPSPLGMA